MKLKLPEAIRIQMIEQAKRDLPNETCGYLAGEADRIQMMIPMTNIDHSTEHFSFDPAEQFQALKSARAKGLRLLAVYHSHPATPARLSQEDLRLANDPDIIYLIVSLQDEQPVLRGFTVIQGAATEVSIQITEGEAT